VYLLEDFVDIEVFRNSCYYLSHSSFHSGFVHIGYGQS